MPDLFLSLVRQSIKSSKPLYDSKLFFLLAPFYLISFLPEDAATATHSIADFESDRNSVFFLSCSDMTGKNICLGHFVLIEILYSYCELCPPPRISSLVFNRALS